LSKRPAYSGPSSSWRLLNVVCEDAARLLSDREERQLTFVEKLGLNIHLAICRGCRRYKRSLAILRHILRRASKEEAGMKLPEDARIRIAHRLREAGGAP
jgi:predicted anti-sigma-YlaC factor YlaD